MPTFDKDSNVLIYKGSNFLKQRLILSTLSGKPIEIRDIRCNDDRPGVRDYEESLIQLFDKITNGTRINLNETGTALRFNPGLLLGGDFKHDCNTQRGIGYYLDVLFALGIFCKHPLNVTLTGVTNSKESPSVDTFKTTAISLLKKFIVVDDGLEFHISKRGVMPDGGGEIRFRCPVRKNVRPIQFLKQGMVKRVRGIAYVTRVSPALANRSVETAKGALLNFIPDIYINTDQSRGKNAGKSPGFGINLVAETTEGVFYSAEVVSNTQTEGEDPSVPEDVGKQVAVKLLDEIYRGGCVDSSFQWLAALYMALGQKDVSKFKTGPFSQYTINFLQHLREFFGITFKLDNQELEDEDENEPGAEKVLMTCIGVGYTNINKRTN